MSEPTPENPPAADEGTTPLPDEGTPTVPPTDETPGGETPPGEEPGGEPEAPVDETPGETPPGGDVVLPPVVLPPTGGEYQQGVDAIYGELTDEVNAPRWSTQMDNLANATRVTYDYVLPIAYELAGPEPESRRMARDAVASLLLTRITEEIHGAQAAAELDDMPEEPEPQPEPPVEPPTEG